MGTPTPLLGLPETMQTKCGQQTLSEREVSIVLARGVHAKIRYDTLQARGDTIPFDKLKQAQYMLQLDTIASSRQKTALDFFVAFLFEGCSQPLGELA